jgi:hypothetical protein
MSANALALVPPSGGVTVNTTALDVMELGSVLARSGYFKDAKDASQAVVKILYGQEIGIGPVSAMMSIHVIEGKPAPSGNLIAARIRGSGKYDYRVREHSGDLCRIEFFALARNGDKESLGLVEFNMEDAKRAELLRNPSWRKYPRAMLFNRAISEGARVHCPEIFGGAPVYTPEELGAEVDAEGNLVVREAEVVGSTAARQMATEAQATFIRNLIQSHVFSADERAVIEARLVDGFKGSVSDAIDGIKAQLDARKRAEKVGGEQVDTTTGEVTEYEGDPMEEPA